MSLPGHALYISHFALFSIFLCNSPATSWMKWYETTFVLHLSGLFCHQHVTRWFFHQWFHASDHQITRIISQITFEWFFLLAFIASGFRLPSAVPQTRPEALHLDPNHDPHTSHPHFEMDMETWRKVMDYDNLHKFGLQPGEMTPIHHRMPLDWSRLSKTIRLGPTSKRFVHALA